MERFQDSRHKTFTCGFSFPTPVLLSRVQPRAHTFDDNHLISGRIPHFRPQGIASAQDRQHSGQEAIGGCGIGEAAFQGRVEKRARIGLRRDLRRGSWHRFETRFAVRLRRPKQCGGQPQQTRPTQPANRERTAHMFGQALEYARALRGRSARPIAKRKKAALGRPSEHLGAYFRYRCSTRSLSSGVRPWFQNCVPMYPQVRRATLSFS